MSPLRTQFSNASFDQLNQHILYLFLAWFILDKDDKRERIRRKMRPVIKKFPRGPSSAPLLR